MGLPDVGELPKGWPPLGPSWPITVKIREGKVISAAELEQLKEEGERQMMMEATDPDFKRALARYRAQCVEEDRIAEVEAELREKAEAVAGQKRRVQQQREAKREARARTRDRGNATRQEVSRQREARRTKLIENIQLTERRALVRDTIQKALIAQSRSDGHAERVTFLSDKNLGDNPGPGTYAPPPIRTSAGANFNMPTSTECRKVAQPRPGPASYDPKRQTSGPAITFGGPAKKGEREDLPGPGAYDIQLKPGKGGKMSSHKVKSELDFALERASHEPGPGDYELGAMLGSGKSSSMAGRTRSTSDMQIANAGRRPGPATYTLPPARVRGGVMTMNSRDDGSLPVLVPGPGAYYQTPTIKQEREMRLLAKQVVRLVKTGGAGAPSAYGDASSAPGSLGRGRQRSLSALEAVDE